MTMAIRYVKNNIDDVNGASIGSTGSDYQLVAFDVTLPRGIDAGVDAVVLTWEGVGEIKSILSVTVRDPSDGEMTPMGSIDQVTHTRMRLDETNKIITIAIPPQGISIRLGSVISLLLVIGGY